MNESYQTQQTFLFFLNDSYYVIVFKKFIFRRRDVIFIRIFFFSISNFARFITFSLRCHDFLRNDNSVFRLISVFALSERSRSLDIRQFLFTSSFTLINFILFMSFTRNFDANARCALTYSFCLVCDHFSSSRRYCLSFFCLTMNLSTFLISFRCTESSIIEVDNSRSNLKI